MGAGSRELSTEARDNVLTEKRARAETAYQVFVRNRGLQTEFRHGLQTQTAKIHAKPALMGYTLRKRYESVDWINELITAPIQAWAVQNQLQGETAQRLAVETW
jgi:hypothetical protein